MNGLVDSNQYHINAKDGNTIFIDFGDDPKQGAKIMIRRKRVGVTAEILSVGLDYTKESDIELDLSQIDIFKNIMRRYTKDAS